MAIGVITYTDASRREDLLDEITNVDFESTPFFSSIGTAVATNTYHEWLTDTLDSVGVNAQIESSDATIVDLAQPVRNHNFTQIFRKVVVVSDTEMAVTQAGMSDPFAYQTTKALKALKRDIERALIAGTAASGSSGVARSLSGAIEQITTNKTALASGTSLGRSSLDQLLKSVYDNGTDASPDLILVGSSLKLAIDQITTKVTQNADAAAGIEYSSFDMYYSAFGHHKVAMSREVPNGGVLAVDTSKWRVAYLQGRTPKLTPLAKVGSSTKGMIETELTLEGLNQKSSAYRSGYLY